MLLEVGFNIQGNYRVLLKGFGVCVGVLLSCVCTVCVYMSASGGTDHRSGAVCQTIKGLDKWNSWSGES